MASTVSPHDAYNKLKQLIGLQLTVIGYAASMKTLGFGSHYLGVSITGKPQYKTAFSLHIQSPWNLLKDSALITGSNDWWIKDQSINDDEEWDPGNGGSLQDRILRSVLEDNDHSRRVLLNQTEHLVVQSVHIVNEFGVSMKLSPTYELNIFPVGTKEEHWRLLEQESGNHYVCENNYFELVGPEVG